MGVGLLTETHTCRHIPADSTPSGHSFHTHPATCSTLIRPGSRSAATQFALLNNDHKVNGTTGLPPPNCIRQISVTHP